MGAITFGPARDATHDAWVMHDIQRCWGMKFLLSSPNESILDLFRSFGVVAFGMQ
jgi:hypothetical protein